MKRIIFASLLCIGAISIQAQHENYVWPKDSQILESIHKWQDWKFGLLMHWGTYSQWGIVESWSLCNEDEGWCQRRGPYAEDFYEYRKQYENLLTTFNPEKFNPEKWASAAKKAGMRYMVFTTKHHDGFCMFDTKETDYKVSSPKSPFHNNPNADIAGALFKSFRNQGLAVGAYFSKPDWHCNDYWWRYFATPDRNVNYDPAKYPEKWAAYKKFTYKQLSEICSNYGKIDLLWLDGGWVRPKTSYKPDWAKSPYDQDIDMESISKMARSKQPGIMIVDRSVGGEFENYFTPEQQIPDKPLSYPWETCLTMATSWSYVPGDKYKSPQEIIQTLCKIVSRGGNLLLNIGPGPDGEWAADAYDRLEKIGTWMAINSNAIYNSKPVAPYQKDNMVLTQVGNNIYLCYMPKEGETTMPDHIDFPDFPLTEIKSAQLNGSDIELKASVSNNKLHIIIPEKLAQNPPSAYCWVIKII